MSELVKQLREANIKGLNPPQNWTHRAIDEIESLLAQLEEMRSEINIISCDMGLVCGDGDSPSAYMVMEYWADRLDKLVDLVPEQSLNTLKARIEEEVIERCAEITLKVDKGVIKTTRLFQSYESIKSQPRKYSAEDE